MGLVNETFAKSNCLSRHELCPKPSNLASGRPVMEADSILNMICVFIDVLIPCNMLTATHYLFANMCSLHVAVTRFSGSMMC